MDNIEIPKFSELYNQENSDIQIIFDEYADTYFYLESYVENIAKITVNLNSQYSINFMK